jgi:ABC-type phosphate transport system substrate-binding protein
MTRRATNLQRVAGSAWLPALIAALCAPLFAASTATSGEVAVVVRPEVPVDNLTFAQMRELLLGDRKFWTGTMRVTLLMRAPATREREVILRTIYHMTEAEFRRYWIEKVFRAEANSGPKIVYSNESATELVAAIPGAVAFVDAAQVPSGLKVLRIEGHLPGDKGYPLH